MVVGAFTGYYLLLRGMIFFEVGDLRFKVLVRNGWGGR